MTEIQKIIQFNLPTVEDKSGVSKNNNQNKSESAISFADTIKDFLNVVNESGTEAAGKVSDIIQGNSENLAEVMTSLAEARLSFQLMLEIRNKLLASFQQIQRMPV